MPTAPKTHRPSHYIAPSERRKQHDQKRDSAKERGYSSTGAWNRFSVSIKRERLFCELCSTINIVTGIVDKGCGITDHIVPLEGKDDPLFLEPQAVWALCIKCDRWKSINFDGSYGARKIVATDRSIAGVQQRREQIVQRFKAANNPPGVGIMSVVTCP